MYDNHLYNLMMQLVQEHQSVWRIKEQYKGDAQDCQECKQFWEQLEKDKLEHIEKLKGLIKKHLCQ